MSLVNVQLEPLPRGCGGGRAQRWEQPFAQLCFRPGSKGCTNYAPLLLGKSVPRHRNWGILGALGICLVGWCWPDPEPRSLCKWQGWNWLCSSRLGISAQRTGSSVLAFVFFNISCCNNRYLLTISHHIPQREAFCRLSSVPFKRNSWGGEIQFAVGVRWGGLGQSSLAPVIKIIPGRENQAEKGQQKSDTRCI